MGRRAVAVASLAGLGLSALACARSPDPASTTCVRVLSRRLPEARVLGVDADHGAARAVVRFEVGETWGEEPARGQLACAVEPVGSEGGWRVREATLDGVALTAAELAVVNADLFLHELARAGGQ
jgi:hypothetical protein